MAGRGSVQGQIRGSTTFCSGALIGCADGCAPWANLVDDLEAVAARSPEVANFLLFFQENRKCSQGCPDGLAVALNLEEERDVELLLVKNGLLLRPDDSVDALFHDK